MLQATKRPVNIYMEANPNPNSMKFVLNFMLLGDGISYDFPDAKSADNSLIAEQLFNFAAVERVFIAANFITVTKKADIEWIDIQDFIKETIKKYFESEQPVVKVAPTSDPLFDPNDSETVKVIKGILDEYIRPAVEQDGGAITFYSFQDGVVKVMLQGSCSGCPSSTVTLKAGIENLLKRMVPEVTSVEALNG
ncbi:NifU family protein [Penaeicola halotolerans]|uniref:NifU family protein n=1 Tax=Penaeicola halotolerans TaxID=2793196 RepID=UPI001CF82EC9|nr:NifU family protein [Penaeicola halotolerans]